MKFHLIQVTSLHPLLIQHSSLFSILMIICFILNIKMKACHYKNCGGQTGKKSFIQMYCSTRSEFDSTVENKRFYFLLIFFKCQGKGNTKDHLCLLVGFIQRKSKFSFLPDRRWFCNLSRVRLLNSHKSWEWVVLSSLMIAY